MRTQHLPVGPAQAAQASSAGATARAVFLLVAIVPWLVASCGDADGAATSPRAAPSPGAVARLHRLFPGLHLRYGGVARITATAPPRSAALPGATDLLTARHAILAATSQGIWRSTDGGSSWQHVLAGIQATGLTGVLSGGYAAIGSLPAKNGPGRSVLATSPDGLHWTTRPTSGRPAGSPVPLGDGYRIALGGTGPHGIGIAVPDDLLTFFTGPPLRSGDGGRTWVPITGSAGRALRGASTGLALTNGGRTVFVTARGPGRRCAGAVYRSGDGGVTWSLLPGSCQPYQLLAVQFISPAVGFAAGGLPAKFGGAQVMEATTDGGRTWRTVLRTPVGTGRNAVSGFVRLDMVSATRGWAVAGGCVGGQNGPCGGTVETTSDGGRRWQLTSQSATSIAGLDADGTTALAGDDFTATMAMTTDGGRTWSPQSPPGWIRSSGFSGTQSFSAWVTTLGFYLSSDAGARWTRADQLAAPRLRYVTWLAGPPARLLGLSGSGSSLATVVSGDGGRTLTTSRVPDRRRGDVLLTAALEAGGTAFAVTGKGAQCTTAAQAKKVARIKPGWTPPPARSTLFTSADGGARWSPTGAVLPFGVGYGAVAAADGRQLAIIDACNRLQVSSDGGGHWRGEAIRRTVFCSVAAGLSQLWLACQSGQAGFWLLHSVDGGSTWTAFALPPAVVRNGGYAGEPFGNRSSGISGIAATGPGGAVMPGGASIWRTADGGRSWTQRWPALAG